MAGALPPEQLSGVPGVVAVALWGPQGGASGGADGERVLGLYYRGQLTVDEIRALDGAAEVSEPGAWGRIANGGARLQVEGRRALVRYRDLEAVEHWSKEAEEGRYEVEAAPDYVAGMPSYALAAELALAEVLAGELPHPGFPEALRASAPGGWAAAAALALEAAGRVASRGDAVECAGLLAKAATAAAQGRLADAPPSRSRGLGAGAPPSIRRRLRRSAGGPLRGAPRCGWRTGRTAM